MQLPRVEAIVVRTPPCNDGDDDNDDNDGNDDDDDAATSQSVNAKPTSDNASDSASRSSLDS